tara:strand:- start:51 stop:338 length:288 start_codon:yes stop_codon:yes gene_type:complete
MTARITAYWRAYGCQIARRDGSDIIVIDNLETRGTIDRSKNHLENIFNISNLDMPLGVSTLISVPARLLKRALPKGEAFDILPSEGFASVELTNL